MGRLLSLQPSPERRFRRSVREAASLTFPGAVACFPKTGEGETQAPDQTPYDLERVRELVPTPLQMFDGNDVMRVYSPAKLRMYTPASTQQVKNHWTVLASKRVVHPGFYASCRIRPTIPCPVNTY